MSIKIIRLPNQKIEKQRVKSSGKIEKQGMVKLIEYELTTKDGLEFCPCGQGTNYKFAPGRKTEIKHSKMKSEEIRNLFERFESAASELEGVECWSARELQHLLGYSKWENFEKAIVKAKDACRNAGEETDYHFPDVRKMITKGKGAKNEIDDILLTRYACYLIAQNGDSRKEL